ncbi:MAG: hypothetical protein KDA65_17760 [Planctomycetaceae bacterium]|nr:hypothetical protein [Planctomycetaceae bacterium]
MSRSITATVALVLILGNSAFAASQFPYEAVVQSDSALVRSHNSQRSAVTNELKQGDLVVVYAHQPGGWYKIVPPEGSFSLIPQSMVEVRADLFGKGIVLQNNAPAYMGSAVGDMNTGVHNKLSKNDEVTILETVTINTQRGPVEMYKIAPPAYEYRWIEGHHLVPADQLEQKTTNPFAIQQQTEAYSPTPSKVDPFSQTASAPQPKTTVVKSDPTPTSNSKGVRRSAPPVAEVEADRTALRELDLAFRDMIDLDPGEWDLDGLEAAYHELQKQTQHKAIAGQVDLRLGAVNRYRKIKSEYDSFIQLTSGTTDREVALRQQQQQIATNVENEPTEVSSVDRYLESGGGPVLGGAQFRPVQQPVEVGAVTPEGPQLNPNAEPTPATIVSTPGGTNRPGDLIGGPRLMEIQQPANGPVLGTPQVQGPATLQEPILEEQPAPSPVQPIAQIDSGVPEFDGAGIIQRTLNPKPGLPQHVLTSPQGKIISYVQPRGNLDLDQYIGKSMGIQGEINFRQDLNRHVLVIDRMMPVTLTR